MINKRRLVRRFLRLAKTPSLSWKEDKVIRIVKKELAKLKIRAVQDEAGNLIAKVKGKGPAILLNAHLDTVPPAEKVSPYIYKKVIYSDGTTILGADNKAGVAVVLEVLRVLKEDRIPHPTLQLVFTVAEEIGLLGAKELNPKKLEVKMGFIMDGGDVDEIINCAPSQDNISAEIIGKAAHAGVHPEEGINAIQVASEAVTNMKLGRIDFETTANIGIIKGGIATNIIPAKVELKGEARSHNPRKLKRQIQHMEKCLTRACKRYGARIRIKVSSAYRSFYVSRKERVMQIALAAAKKAGIRKPIVKKSGGGSDANIFNRLGIPSVILGVGADRVHTVQERIAIEDMLLGAELLVEVLRGLSE